MTDLEARVAIADVVARYAQAVDRGRIDDVVALFAADGVLAVRGEDHAGPAGIRALFEEVARSLPDRTRGRIAHHVSSLAIAVDGATATARSYFLVLDADGPNHWGRYRDALAFDGTAWRFTRREAITDGFARGPWPEA